MEEAKKELSFGERVKQSLPLVYLVIGLLALRSTVVEPYVVPTGSMEPTLKTGDRLYALKFAYGVRVPFTDIILFRTGQVKRGDVILFQAPHDPSITYVKRAVGLPGDRIEFRQGVLYVNGEAQKKAPAPDREVMYDIEREDKKTLYVEDLTGLKHYVILNQEPYGGSHRDIPERTIPPDHLFAVGDNRDNSYDSRAWGFVPMQNLKGKGMFIWFSSWNTSPYDDWLMRLIHWFAFWEWRPRPERIGTLIQ